MKYKYFTKKVGAALLAGFICVGFSNVDLQAQNSDIISANQKFSVEKVSNSDENIFQFASREAAIQNIVSVQSQDVKRSAQPPVLNSVTVRLEENFTGEEFPPDGWTIVDSDGDGQNWFRYTAEGAPHSGTATAASSSWNQAPLNPDNWMISPAVELGPNDVLEFWAGAQDPDWPAEKYTVYLSTTGTDIEDFTEELFSETMTDGNWYRREIDLSDYAGETVHIAWRHHPPRDGR